MRILVTGGAGFIGSQLVGALRRREDEVVVLDNLDPTYDPALKWENLRVEGVVTSPGPARLVQGDLRDAAAVQDALQGVDAVVHMAAVAGVRDSLSDPLRYEDINIRGTLVLLEQMRRAGKDRLVFASSSSVYGAPPGDGRFHEDLPADRPVSPYAATKRAAELLCHAAHATWGLHCACLRFFTVYGPRQRPAMAISHFIRLALAGEQLPLFGDGSSVRDYTYVDDAVRGVCAALDRSRGYQVLNLGCGQPIRLDGLVQAIGEAVGRPVQVHHLPDQAGDVPRTHADIRRAAALLDWQPQVSLPEGLRTTVRWIQDQG